uniref:MFS transporter n=1 Tax=Saccharopolyspora galaxeae TaxID=2781241 RepID=UPI0035B04946
MPLRSDRRLARTDDSILAKTVSPATSAVLSGTDMVETWQKSAVGRTNSPRMHQAWRVITVAGMTIIAARAFTTMSGLLVNPLHHEFGWSHATIGAAVSVNMTLYGLTAPFAAALMDRLGTRRVVAGALAADTVLDIRSVPVESRAGHGVAGRVVRPAAGVPATARSPRGSGGASLWCR